MAPITHVAEVSSQQVLAQAAQQLLNAVRENGAEPSPFAVALLDLMEHSSKLQEYEQMLAVANQEAESEEAKTWQQVSLMTLQYCQKGLVEQQQRALQKVTKLMDQGDSLFQVKEESSTPPEAVPEAVAETVPEVPATDVVTKRVPPSAAPPPAPAATNTPKTPPGVWVTRPPPGLEAPPGLEPPPGLTTMAEVKKKPLAPWRKAAEEKKAKQQDEVQAAQAVAMLGINFDAFSSEEDD